MLRFKFQVKDSKIRSSLSSPSPLRISLTKRFNVIQQHFGICPIFYLKFKKYII